LRRVRSGQVSIAPEASFEPVFGRDALARPVKVPFLRSAGLLGTLACIDLQDNLIHAVFESLDQLPFDVGLVVPAEFCSTLDILARSPLHSEGGREKR